MTAFSGTHHIYLGLHDRAMLLLGATTALRGEGSRMLQWSDLFLLEVCADDIATGHALPVRASTGTAPFVRFPHHGHF